MKAIVRTPNKTHVIPECSEAALRQSRTCFCRGSLDSRPAKNVRGSTDFRFNLTLAPNARSTFREELDVLLRKCVNENQCRLKHAGMTLLLGALRTVEMFVWVVIRTYQITLSPFLGAHCRFSPSCSQYTDEAIGQFGLFRGAAKALSRFLRCNPFSPGGHDPVSR